MKNMTTSSIKVEGVLKQITIRTDIFLFNITSKTYSRQNANGSPF